MSLIMAIYVGVAKAAYALVLECVAQKRDDPQTPYLMGAMTNALVTAQIALEGMLAIKVMRLHMPRAPLVCGTD